MTISYPLAFPSAKAPAQVAIRIADVIGGQRSPMSLEETLYDWGGDLMEADVVLPPLTRPAAEEFIGFLWALRGTLGTFLMGDPLGVSPRGTWAGSPQLVGNHAAGARELDFDGFTPGATGKVGDWIQFGSGSSTRLHKVLEDFTADGGGLATVSIGPQLRAGLLDDAVPTVNGAVGRWRLASNVREYSIAVGQLYGVRFSCVEAREA